MILVTGATGFVGRSVVAHLVAQGHAVRALGRNPDRLAALGRGVDARATGELSTVDWRPLLEGVQLVVHAAAHVHQMDAARARAEDFERVNTNATHALAQAAAAAGVRRLVFLSTIGVNGSSSNGAAFTAEDAPHPGGAYAHSKWLAEQKLQQVHAASGLEVAVLRPPLVYGPAAPGNFARLLSWVRRGRPLPLGSVGNRRSFLFVENLTSLIAHCLALPSLGYRVLLPADSEVVSTRDFVTALAHALRSELRLLPVPVPVLQLLGSLTGKRAQIDQLVNDLWIDPACTRALGWQPPFPQARGLQLTVEGA